MLHLDALPRLSSAIRQRSRASSRFFVRLSSSFCGDQVSGRLYFFFLYFSVALTRRMCPFVPCSSSFLLTDSYQRNIVSTEALFIGMLQLSWHKNIQFYFVLRQKKTTDKRDTFTSEQISNISFNHADEAEIPQAYF